MKIPVQSTNFGTKYISLVLFLLALVNPSCKKDVRTLVQPTLSDFIIPSKTFGEGAFEIAPPKSNSVGTFSYSSSNTSVATVDGNMLQIIGAGETTVTANQAADGDFLSGSISVVFAVTPRKPDLAAFSMPNKQYGDPSFTISPPVSASGGAFSYSSSNPSVATVDGATVSIVGVGESIITAAQAANGNFAASETSATLKVVPAVPRIAEFSFATRKYGDKPFSIAHPESNSNGTFTYTSSDAYVATIKDNVLTIHGVGETVVTANQAADGNFVAGKISATLRVDPVPPTFGQFSIGERKLGDPSFVIKAPASESNGAFTYSSNKTSVAKVEGSTLEIVGPGEALITARQAAHGNYTAAEISAKLTVTVVPDFEGPVVNSFTFTPQTIDITNEAATVTVTAHLTDVTGVKGGPTVYIQNQSNVTGTQRTGQFKLTSGTARNGIYTAIVTIPIGLQPGEWSISSNSFMDLRNNSGALSPSPTSAKKTLTVLNHSAQDFDGPEILSYTFSPQTIDISKESAKVTVTAHVKDVSGVRSAPIVYIQHPQNVTGTQQTGFFKLTSGTAKDGIYTVEINIPAGLQPGEWRVFSNSFMDVRNNSSISTPSPTSAKKTLTVINGN